MRKGLGRSAPSSWKILERKKSAGGKFSTSALTLALEVTPGGGQDSEEPNTQTVDPKKQQNSRAGPSTRGLSKWQRHNVKAGTHTL